MVKGDFSRWPEYPKGYNFNGILYQQGRVLSDVDGTTKTRLDNDWHQVAAGDIIGKGVAAIPADEPNSFKIQSAKLDTSQQKVLVEVMSGRAWIDGMLAYLENEPPQVSRLASYLGPPFHDTPPPKISTGVKDAVILELHQDAVNAFQLPDTLIESALGGPDTAEILHTSLAFRLLRLSQDDNCSTIPSKLEDNLSERGRLTVSLQKNPPVSGDCPVDENYGYTGPTHNLYRIEIADTNNNGGSPKFKYSQFDGGLVGRGKYTDPSIKEKIRIVHNLQAILWSGLTDSYLEIVTFDAEAGYWKVTYGTNASLNSENELVLSTTPVLGTSPPPEDADGNGVFFRLWNGIRDISDFTIDAPPTMLMDGIRLKFDLPTVSNYRPLDYWIFEVRAGGLENDEKLIDNSPPHGIYYHRVPLAIIEWDVAPTGQTTASVVEDCRVIFPPLITQKEGGCCCCSFSVGDGVSSHGDYDSLQDAIDKIGELGGVICLLKGKHPINVIVNGKNNLVIRGCGNISKVLNKDNNSPIITITNSRTIIIEDIEFETHKSAAVIHLDNKIGEIEDIKIQDNTIKSANKLIEPLLDPKPMKALIEVYNGINVLVRENKLSLEKSTEAAIYVLGENITVRNNIVSSHSSSVLEGDIKDEGIGGGVQVGSGSQRINVIQNKIDGGSGNGITLGDKIFGAPPIYEVIIEGNEISGMGLSGIGVTRIHPGDTVVLGNAFYGIGIFNNRIYNCVQNPFDDSMLYEIGQTHFTVPFRGFGGIIIPHCWDVIIEDNFIQNNGRPAPPDPICGIFLGRVYGVRIKRNHIVDNRDTSVNVQFDSRSRGGVLLMASNGHIQIHDNVISTLVGRALRIGGYISEASILNNYFSGKLQEVPDEVHQGEYISIYMVQIGGRSIIFENNQSYVGYFRNITKAHFIKTDADLCFGSNHMYCGKEVLENTHLEAHTLRACENRFRESGPLVQPKASLYSLGFSKNNTTNNQGDNCIWAIGFPAAVTLDSNQILGNPDRCTREGLNLTSEVPESYD